MKYKVIVTSNIDNTIEEIYESYDALIAELGELLEGFYDDLERLYPNDDICWVNRFWGDDHDLITKSGSVTTEIYVAGQDGYCRAEITRIA